MKKLIPILLSVAMLSLSTVTFTSCGTTGGVGGVVTSAQSWLADPKNQALIQEIAGLLIGMVGEKRGFVSTNAVGQLAVKYPNVPAGALVQIASNPKAYLKK